MSTRSTHKVRITNPNDSTMYVDVQVIDKVVLIAPNGKEYLVDVTAATNAHPFILDNTGDGNSIGSPYGCSRSSHMVQLVGDDPTQMLDVEVLDAISLLLPDNHEMTLMIPKSGIFEAIVDNTGHGLGVAATSSTTRATHIAEIKQLTDGTVSDTDAAIPTGSGAPPTSKFILDKKVDAISFLAPNNEEWLMLIPKAGIDDIDTTQYTTDAQGNKAPPENIDPDLYVRWPKDSKGPWLGSTVVAMGPLWWIVGSTGPSGPWYWWIPVQQPYEWSQDTTVTPELSNNFAEAVWVSRRLPNIGCDYGMWNETTTTGPDAPLATFGFPSLEACIFAGEDPVNGFAWGLLDLEVNFPKCVPGVSGTPDIWDITGIPNLPQIPPPPGSPPGTAPTDQPVPPALAAQVATAYATQWNQTTQWCNDDQAALDGTTRIQYVDYIYYSGPNGTTALVRPAFFPYPRTAFHVPLGFPVGAPNFGIDTGTFIGGIPAGYWFSGGELWIFQPAYATYQNTGQLDPKRWDTSNPANPVYIGPTDGSGKPLPP